MEEYTLSNKVREKDVGQTVEREHFTLKGTLELGVRNPGAVF